MSECQSNEIEPGLLSQRQRNRIDSGQEQHHPSTGGPQPAGKLQISQEMEYPAQQQCQGTKAGQGIADVATAKLHVNRVPGVAGLGACAPVVGRHRRTRLRSKANIIVPM